MPNTKSAIRRVRRVKKQTQTNRIKKSKYKNAIKQHNNAHTDTRKQGWTDVKVEIVMQIIDFSTAESRLHLYNLKRIFMGVNIRINTAKFVIPKIQNRHNQEVRVQPYDSYNFFSLNNVIGQFGKNDWG